MPADWLIQSLSNPDVVARYRSYCRILPNSDCVGWVGALMRSGHGRFWVAATTQGQETVNHVVIAHRFGWAIQHGAENLDEAEVLEHMCDEPWCQNPNHLQVSTHQDNQIHWMIRRQILCSPLRDTRGRLGRAKAIRQALLDDFDPSEVMQAGIPLLDLRQLTLW